MTDVTAYGAVHFPPGTYITDTLTIPSGVTLLTVDGTSDVRIEGLTLDGLESQRGAEHAAL